MRGHWLLGLTVAVAACAPGGVGSSPGLAPEVRPSAAPATVVPSIPLPSVSTSPSLPSSEPSAVASVGPALAATELVTGGIYSEDLNPVRGAQLIVESSDERFNQTLEVPPGIFVLKDVPVGTVLTLTATAPGYNRRTRKHTVRARVMGVDEYPNRIDFGGAEAGMMYYISKNQFEIGRTDPGPLAKDIVGDPLSVRLFFTGALDLEEQGRLRALLRVRAAGDESAFATMGTTWGDTLRAQLDWDTAGESATLRFPVPVVARAAGAWALVELDPAARIEDYPFDELGRRLGFARVADTADGGGAAVRNRIAPFVRRAMPEPAPSVRPSPEALWGLTHATSLKFEVARDVSPLKVEAVEPQSGSGTRPDSFRLRFNKPVYGFPEGALSPLLKQGSSFRFVLGNTGDTSVARRAFEDADAAKDGAPGGSVSFRPETPRVLLVETKVGLFNNYNRYKLHVNKDMVDIYGVELGGDGQTFEGSL